MQGVDMQPYDLSNAGYTSSDDAAWLEATLLLHPEPSYRAPCVRIRQVVMLPCKLNMVIASLAAVH